MRDSIGWEASVWQTPPRWRPRAATWTSFASPGGMAVRRGARHGAVRSVRSVEEPMRERCFGVLGQRGAAESRVFLLNVRLFFLMVVKGDVIQDRSMEPEKTRMPCSFCLTRLEPVRTTGSWPPYRHSTSFNKCVCVMCESNITLTLNLPLRMHSKQRRPIYFGCC